MERLLSRHLLPRTPSAAARYATAAEQRTKAMQRRWAFGRWGMVMSTMGRISARTGRCFYWCLWNIDKYYMYILSWLYCLRNIGWYDGIYIYIYDQYEGRIVPLARFDVFFCDENIEWLWDLSPGDPTIFVPCFRYGPKAQLYVPSG